MDESIESMKTSTIKMPDPAEMEAMEKDLQKARRVYTSRQRIVASETLQI